MAFLKTFKDISASHLCLCAQSLSHIKLFVTPWTAAHQPSLSMGFSRQEYCSGLPFPPPGNPPDPRIETASLAWQAYFFTTEPPGQPTSDLYMHQYSTAQFPLNFNKITRVNHDDGC